MKEYFSEKQKAAITYFKANRDNWLKNPLYKDKFIIIHDNNMVGIYDNFETAFIEAEGKYQRGNYIIQELFDEKEEVSFYYPAIPHNKLAGGFVPITV